jgi:hypothetical protein
MSRALEQLTQVVGDVVLRAAREGEIPSSLLTSKIVGKLLEGRFLIDDGHVHLVAQVEWAASRGRPARAEICCERDR